MNILFLSRLSNNNNCGPYYSVPRQVAAQREYDNVFWLNVNSNYFEEWAKIGDVKTEKEYPSLHLKDLPEPFNHPDVVLVQEQYNFFRMPLIRDIQKARIPYVVVPRCSLTYSAQQKKRLKKIVGNYLYFNRFLRKASGIQYLTNQEKKESGEHWNSNGFVIPNGINIPNIKKGYNTGKIECTFIGRIDFYHKGLDLLLNAIMQSVDIMSKANMHLSIYGWGLPDDLEKLNVAIKKCNSIVEFRGPVHGNAKEKVLLESDVFFLTSRFEGMPMGLLEAMSYGIPVMITKGTNMKSIVKKYDCGWYSDSSETGIKKMIQAIICERESIPEKGENGVRAAELFDWSNIAKKTHEELEKIVANCR